MKVKRIMTAPVVTVFEDAPIAEMAALLRTHRISAVPVLDAEGAVVGLVSEYDLLAREGTTARQVMTSQVITVSEETDVEEVRHLLVERGIRRVPVLAGQRLVGIVSRSDVVALLTTEWACQVCGQITRGDHPPQHCPTCHAGPDRFEVQEPSPGS